MSNSKKTTAELYIATGCTHCPVVLNELSERLKRGEIASLNVTNIAVDPVEAEKLNVRSVPWFSLSNQNSFMIFSGAHTPKEIQKWVSSLQSETAMQDYIEELLGEGQLATVIQVIQLKPEMFATIVSMLEDEETSVTTRIGLDALIENFSGTDTLKNHTSELKKIAATDNPRLQIDALHYIALTGAAENKEFIQEYTSDKNQQVKDAAIEALETLEDMTE